MEDKDYNIFNLITQAQLSINWIKETCINVDENDTINDKLQKFRNRNEGILPLNTGVILMASYMYIVLPKESIFNKLSINNINTDKFYIKMGSNNSEKIIRSVRNALAHGNVLVSENGKSFVFKDRKNSESPFHFSAEINFADFAEFISNYYFILKKQFFLK